MIARASAAVATALSHMRATRIHHHAEDMMKALRGLIAVVLASLLAGCGYNTIQQKEEAVKSAWAEVLSQYQRRADLIPNIVNTVKGEADFEKSTLQNVIEARERRRPRSRPLPN
jgi:hypothetical protein